MTTEKSDTSGDAVLVHYINKRDNEQVRFSLSKYSGTEFIDIRSFYLPKGGSEFKPSRKGVTLRHSEYLELLSGVIKVGKELGLVDNDFILSLEKLKPEQGFHGNMGLGSATGRFKKVSQGVYGISLGRDYCSIARVNENGVPEVIPGDNQSFVTPSFLTFLDGETVLVGDEARTEARFHPDGVVERIKDHMGEVNDDGSAWTINRVGRDWRPEEVSSLILKKVATNVANYNQGETVKKVVITVPAYFDSDQRTATEQAGQLAGFEVMGLIPEPTAAAIAYSVDHQEDQTILVYDLGGGTFDTTVINLADGNVTVVATGGSKSLGGWRWNEQILDLLKDEWQSNTGSTDDPLENSRTRIEWSNAAEDAKRVLTNRDGTDIYVDHDGTTVRLHLDLDHFNEITRDLLNQTIDYTAKTLEQARRKEAPDIDKILLVGGSCYMRQVRLALEERFKVDVESHRPELAVVIGASRYATDSQIRRIYSDVVDQLGVGATEEDIQKAVQNRVPGRVNEAQVTAAISSTVTNVSSKNFGTVAHVRDTDDDYIISYVIKKNEAVPADHTKIFTTSIDNQNALRFSIIESDADDVPNSEPLESTGSTAGGERWTLPDHAHQIGVGVLKLSGD